MTLRHRAARRSGTDQRTLAVLLVGTDNWAVAQAAASLSEAGHTPLLCHAIDDVAFPCNAMIEGRVCPLDVGFDVVVDLRAHAANEPTPGEMGAICALHAGAPLVLAGIVRNNPFAPWAADTVKVSDELVDVVERVSVTHPREVGVDLREPESRSST